MSEALLEEPGEGVPRGRGGDHQLVRFQDLITEEHWIRALAVHEAAHAVVARAMGMTVLKAYVVFDRTSWIGGEVEVEGPNDAQAVAVHKLAGPMAHGQYVRRLGYSSLTQAAVEVLVGQGDESRVLDYLTQGFIIWHRQARRDAEAILRSRRVWRAIHRVAEELVAKGALTGEDIVRIVGPRRLTRHRVWLP